MVHSRAIPELSTLSYSLLAKKRVGTDFIQSRTRQVHLHDAVDTTSLTLEFSRAPLSDLLLWG